MPIDFSHVILIFEIVTTPSIIREENPRKKTKMSFLIFDFCHYNGLKITHIP